MNPYNKERTSLLNTNSASVKKNMKFNLPYISIYSCGTSSFVSKDANRAPYHKVSSVYDPTM